MRGKGCDGKVKKRKWAEFLKLHHWANGVVAVEAALITIGHIERTHHIGVEAPRVVIGVFRRRPNGLRISAYVFTSGNSDTSIYFVKIRLII